MKNVWKLSALPAAGLLALIASTPVQAMEFMMFGCAFQNGDDGVVKAPIVDFAFGSEGIREAIAEFKLAEFKPAEFAGDPASVVLQCAATD